MDDQICRSHYKKWEWGELNIVWFEKWEIFCQFIFIRFYYFCDLSNVFFFNSFYYGELYIFVKIVTIWAEMLFFKY